MNKFFFYSLWNCEKVEKFLNQMEQEGFRLEIVFANYFFQFKKSSPKTVEYVYSYAFLKNAELYHDESEIRRVYNADIIPTRLFSNTRIHRITKLNDIKLYEDLKTFNFVRDVYFRKGLIQRAVLLVMLIIGSASAYLKFCWSIFLYISILLLCLIIYSAYGCIVLSKRLANRNY